MLLTEMSIFIYLTPSLLSRGYAISQKASLSQQFSNMNFYLKMKQWKMKQT